SRAAPPATVAIEAAAPLQREVLGLSVRRETQATPIRRRQLAFGLDADFSLRARRGRSPIRETYLDLLRLDPAGGFPEHGRHSRQRKRPGLSGRVEGQHARVAGVL